ncbi:MAG: radical SAM protein, partial [Planctomycetes bacterium]|nr:radical SAM protein [Planctomycetota bacterium]
NAALLESTRKGVTLESITEAFRLTREARIRSTASFVLGLPGETPATVEETIRFARRLKPDHASFHIFAPYEGTRLHGEAVAAGRIEPGAFDRTRVHANLRAYRTEGMTAEALDAARRRAYRAFYRDPRYLARRLMNSSRREISFYARTLLGLRGDIRTAEASVREALLGGPAEKLAR